MTHADARVSNLCNTHVPVVCLSKDLHVHHAARLVCAVIRVLVRHTKFFMMQAHDAHSAALHQRKHQPHTRML